MEWTIERIRELCVEYCGKCGVKFNSPVIINNRLTRTLGRCFCYCMGEVWNPSKIEISQRLLETATDDSIAEVIAHECAHYVTVAITHRHHGHDAIFRHYCKIIGTSFDSAIYNNIPKEKLYKYTIYCSKCGKLVANRSRACNLTKYPEDFYSDCCKADLRVVQNW